MGSGAMTYIPSLIKIGSGIQKLMGVTQTHKHHKPTSIFFFKIREVGQKEINVREEPFFHVRN
jgi:hypothetical protein